MMLLRAVLAARGNEYTLGHFGLSEDATMDKAEFDQLIEELKQK